MLGLESFSVGGDFRHYQGDFNEVDFGTTCPGATCGALTRRVSSGGAQSLSGAFVQAIIAPVTPLRIELSARVDRWDNNDGHSISTTPTTTATTARTATAARRRSRRASASGHFFFFFFRCRAR